MSLIVKDIFMEWLEFCKKLEGLLPCYEGLSNICYDDEAIVYRVANYQTGDIEFKYTIADFDVLKNKISGCKSDSFAIIKPNSYEILIEPVGDEMRPSVFLSQNRLQQLGPVNDNELGLLYSFEKISDEFLWFLLESLDYEYLKWARKRPPIFVDRLKYNTGKSLLEIVKFCYNFPLALRITTQKTIPPEKISNCANSFLFNFAYNTDLVFRKVSTLDSIFPQRTILNKINNKSFGFIESPKLSYEQDLVEQYFMAVASENPFIKFIGYYHIIEHFFDNVCAEELLLKVKEIIQDPGFSSKRNKDLMKIVNAIRPKSKKGKERYTDSEEDALILTLIKYVDLNELRDRLKDIDPSLVEHYANRAVSFSKGTPFNLESEPAIKTYEQIAKRIYSTRNSLVHYKSNELRVKERGVYQPFKDGQELLKEIPLMRCIAEIIIIKTAKEI